jgi:ferritin-like metal-binding protein YciE
MADLSIRDAKLVQYLNEAYGKERELETALQAHIGMTTRIPYRKRLQQHLTETKRHAREVQRRVKQLGGEPEVLPLPGPDAVSQAAGAAVELGSRALAATKGPLHAIRGTGEQEKMLKNAKTEYSEEHEEIATYRAIETLASSLGDTATAQLARAIRREEERMASFLARLIPTLTKAVVTEEVPAAERRAAGGGKRASAARRGSAKRAGAKRTGAKAGAAKRTAKATAGGSGRAARSASSKGRKASAGGAPKRRTPSRAASSPSAKSKAGGAKGGRPRGKARS